MTEERPCCRCHERPRSGGKWYCNACHATRVRERRAGIPAPRSGMTILGKPFHVYTLHAPDPRGGDDQMNTQEGWYTVTLAAINGLQHREPACIMVTL